MGPIQLRFAAMISFKKLLGKEEKFYDLLEASAEEARLSTEGYIV